MWVHSRGSPYRAMHSDDGGPFEFADAVFRVPRARTLGARVLCYNGAGERGGARGARIGGAVGHVRRATDGATGRGDSVRPPSPRVGHTRRVVGERGVTNNGRLGRDRVPARRVAWRLT